MHVALVCPHSMSNPHEKQAFWFAIFYRVWDVWNARLSVLDHLGPAHRWHGDVVVSTVSASATIVSIVASPFIASGATVPTSSGTWILLLLSVWLRLLHICLILRYRRCDWCNRSWKRLRDRQWCRGLQESVANKAFGSW